MRIADLEESSGYSLAGSFTHDLVVSKAWLMTELAKIQPEISTLYILGSWYGNLALYMQLQPTFKYTNIINVETDQGMLDQSERMLDRVGANNVEYVCSEFIFEALRDTGNFEYQEEYEILDEE